MPRTARATAGNVWYHIVNRGNGRSRVFHDAQDYQNFSKLLAQAIRRVPVRVIAFCLMPNHFHLVASAFADGELGRWMQWLMTSHVRRHHRKYGGSGHVWQGRYKSFPVQPGEHLLTVIRYVERNALQAGLVTSAEQWAWSSLRPSPWVASWPSPRPSDWVTMVNTPQTEKELCALRLCQARGRPYGAERWTHDLARLLGIESCVRPRGRPRKVAGV